MSSDMEATPITVEVLKTLLSKQCELIRRCRNVIDAFLKDAPQYGHYRCGTSTLGALQKELHKQKIIRPEDVFLPPGNPILDDPIYRLGITRRVRNCLAEGGIDYVYDLVKHSEEELLELYNFGQGALKEVNDALKRHGLSLGM